MKFDYQEVEQVKATSQGHSVSVREYAMTDESYGVWGQEAYRNPCVILSIKVDKRAPVHTDDYFRYQSMGLRTLDEIAQQELALVLGYTDTEHGQLRSDGYFITYAYQRMRQDGAVHLTRYNYPQPRWLIRVKADIAEDEILK